MRSIFTVTCPNSAGLLTLAEAKTALGIIDNTRDADLNRLIAKISAGIYRACNVRSDGVSPPTLLSEELTDSFHFDARVGIPVQFLQLSRRRVTEIITLTEGGAAVNETAYEIDRAAGHMQRLSAANGDPAGWMPGRIIVNYVAGFEMVPEDLKLAAETWLRSLWHSSYETPASVADTSLKVDDIPGVRRIERFAPEGGSSTASAATLLPPEVESILIDGGYVEHWIA